MHTRHSLTSLARHTAVWIGLAILSPTGWADESSDLDRLESIYRTALQNPSQALGQLHAFASKLTADAPYAVRVELLRTRIPLLVEVGRVAEADADIAELLRLGQKHQDLSIIVRAKAFAASQLIEADRPDQALHVLLEAKDQADRNGGPIALLAWNRAMGDVYGKLGNFEKAIGPRCPTRTTSAVMRSVSDLLLREKSCFMGISLMKMTFVSSCSIPMNP